MTAPLDATLGRLAAAPSGTPFDDVRLAMLDRLIAGRRADGATHAPWQAAWDDASAGLRDRVLQLARDAVAAAARHSRYPARRLRALDPDDETADILKQRLLAEGIPLERFEHEPVDPATDRARAAALEQAWDGAIRVASSDLARWRSVAQQVAAWRPPMRAYWIGVTILLGVTLLVAAWLGGQVAAPPWFQPVHDWWWSLPWP